MANSIHDSFQKIIFELKKLQDPEIKPQFPPSFPGLIAAGPDQSILVNAEIENCISEVASWLRSQRPAIKSKYEIKEWNTIVRRAFGPALMKIDLDGSIEDNGRILKQVLEDTVNAEPQIIPLQYTAMGCTLFYEPVAAPFEIGPVRFETKESWLDRARDSDQIDRDSYSRLKHAFLGHPLPIAGETMQNIFEKSITEALQPSQLICTVTTKNLASGMTGARAILGARLAQMSIALLWEKSSRALEGFHLSVDHGPRKFRMVPFIPGQKTIGGWRIIGSPCGPNMNAKKWDDILTERKNFFYVSGRMIEYWTNGDAENKKNGLISNMAAALWLMWEGCRDENNLMSIVKFTGALEFLSQGAGGKSGGITTLAIKRLGLKPDDKISGEKTLKQVVDQIYSEGRSRTLHGTNPFIDHDWSDTRQLAETFTRHCLVACMRWLEDNPAANDPKDLIT